VPRAARRRAGPIAGRHDPPTRRAREQDPSGLAIVTLDRDLERLAQLPQLRRLQRLMHRRAARTPTCSDGTC
jgi:hypothetical protein